MPAAVAAAGLLAWFLYAHAWLGPPGPDGRRAVATDWIALEAAARSALDGRLETLYDGFRFTRDLAALDTGALRPNIAPFLPFLYPPHALLLLAPFGPLGFVTSYLAFAGIGLAAAAMALWLALPAARRGAGAALLLCPATLLCLRVGQTSLLVAGLLLGGLALRERRPVLAGLLLGLLSLKPQFWLLVPVALAAGRHWRTLKATLLGAALLVATSAAVFGPGPWRDWLRLILAPDPAFHAAYLQYNQLFGTSLFACAALLGLPQAVAGLVQAAGTLGAAVAVWHGFRRPLDEGGRQALLLTATVVAAPNVSSYDMVLLGLAALLLKLRAGTRGLGPGEPVLLAVLWLAGLFAGPRIDPLSYAVPAAAIVTLARLARPA